MEIKTIGFVGVGTMGRGMVKNLAKSGFKVLAYNRTKEKIIDMKSDNISVVDSIRGACQGDIVITCLPDDKAVEDAVFGKEGIMENIKGEVFVDCGTTSIEMTKKLNGACNGKKIEFLDAPITGSKLGAEAGTMTIMVGGKKEVFDRCLGVFKAMGKTYVYCGPVTYGQKAKLALQMAQAMILESYLECIVFAVKNDVPLEAMERIMENSAAKNGVGMFKMQYIKKRDFEPHFMLKLMHKDLGLAEKEMKRLGMDLPLAKHIREVFEKSMGRGEEDVSAIVKELEKKAGIELRES